MAEGEGVVNPPEERRGGLHRVGASCGRQLHSRKQHGNEPPRRPEQADERLVERDEGQAGEQAHCDQLPSAGRFDADSELQQ